MGRVLRPTPASHVIDVATFTYQKLFVKYTFLISIKCSVHSPCFCNNRWKAMIFLTEKGHIELI